MLGSSQGVVVLQRERHFQTFTMAAGLVDDKVAEWVELELPSLLWSILEEKRWRILESLNGDANSYPQQMVDEWMEVLQERDKVFTLRYDQELREEFLKGLWYLDSILNELLSPDMKKFAPSLSISFQQLECQLKEFCGGRPKRCEDIDGPLPSTTLSEQADNETTSCTRECQTDAQPDDHSGNDPSETSRSAPEKSTGETAGNMEESSSPSKQVSYNSLIGSYRAFDSSYSSVVHPGGYSCCPHWHPPLLVSMEEAEETKDREEPSRNIKTVPDVVPTVSTTDKGTSVRASKIPVPVANRKSISAPAK